MFYYFIDREYKYLAYSNTAIFFVVYQNFQIHDSLVSPCNLISEEKNFCV